jgi:hypothetical protein
MSDIFNNPMVESAKKQMTPQQLEEYKQIGESMYNTLDFNTNEILNNPDDPKADSIAYITEGIKSGLHPSFLTDEELQIMEEYYGKTWYLRFGFDSLLLN